MPITKLVRTKNDTEKDEAFEDEAERYFENDGPSSLSFSDRRMIETEQLIRNSELPEES